MVYAYTDAHRGTVIYKINNSSSHIKLNTYTPIPEHQTLHITNKYSHINKVIKTTTPLKQHKHLTPSLGSLQTTPRNADVNYINTTLIKN